MPSMKTTIDIPDEALEEAMRLTNARTKKEAVVAAITGFNRRKRLEWILDQQGTFEGFMTQDELRRLREEG